jgi:hypothetical protein
MSSIHFTPEFVKACELLWRDGFDKGGNGEDDIPDFKTFFGEEKLKEVKEVPSYEAAANLPFNPEKCEARMEKHGFAVQCTRNPFADGCLCKTHQNSFDKLGPDAMKGGKDIPYGRFNQDRPDETCDKGNTIKWDGLERLAKKSQSKNKTSPNQNQPKLKVGPMRDYLSTRIPNTAFKELKKKELTELYLSEKEKENNSSSDEVNTSPIGSPKLQGLQELQETEVIQELQELQETEVIQELQETEVTAVTAELQETEVTAEPMETEVTAEPSPSQRKKEQITLANGESLAIDLGPVESVVDSVVESVVESGPEPVLSLEPVQPETLLEYKELFKSLNIDFEGLKGRPAFKQAYDEHLKEEKEKTEPLSEDDDDLQEDVSSFDETDFEGVSYLEDEETGKIYNPKHQHVGKWNENVDDIIWVSEDFKNTHETSRP